MLLQYQPRICHLSILRLEQSSQHLQGNAWRWLWHVQALPPSLSRLGGSLVFRPDARFYTPVGPCIVVMVILAHAIAKVLKTERKKSWLEGGDFLNGHHCSSCRPSPPPPQELGATAVSRGGCECGVVAAASVPQGICSRNHQLCCLVVSHSRCLPHGRC